MRCSTLMRWTILCAAVLLIAAPAALAQDHEHAHGHDHGHGEAAAEGQAAPSAEEQAMMAAWQESMTPGSQHAHLAEAVGKYNLVIKHWMEPGAEPMTSEGTAVRSMALGGRVMVEEVEATTMGQPFHGVGRTGYDNVTEKYWSTWTDDMSTGITVMYGTMNEDGTGSFEGQTADPMTGGMSTMRIKMRTEGDKEINDFFMVGPDGSEMKMMEITYTPAS
jgi:hypothetical protein